MIYKCDECTSYFDEPEEVRTTYEDFYGVGSVFPNKTDLSYYICPHCGSFNYTSVREEDIDE